MKILGIDPGIANTGLAVVERKNQTYTLLATLLVRSSPKEREPERLLNIYTHVYGLLNQFDVEIAVIEAVYHNKNVSSSIKTGKAIGAAQVAIAAQGKDILELTPQQVKCSSGLGTKANKTHLIAVARRLFGKSIDSHHVADAALTALAGCLQLQKRR